MDPLHTLRVFVAVADAQGFAAAARALHTSPPQVTRAIAALEARLGLRLLHRSTRHLRLTEVGERYLADVRRLLADLDEAEAQARGAHVVPQGQLIVTAPVLFGRMHVAPLLLSFLRAHPQVTARTLLVDRVVNLLDEGVDVAVRIAHLPDSSLTAVRVGQVRRVIVAAEAYLAQAGEPQVPADLTHHVAIGTAITGGEPAPWALAAEPGRTDRLVAGPQPRFQLTANGGDVSIQAAREGHGLARALSYQVDDDVRAGRLKVVLAAHEPAPIPVYLVHAEGRRASAKVRAFVDHAAEHLRAHPALNGSRCA